MLLQNILVTVSAITLVASFSPAQSIIRDLSPVSEAHMTTLANSDVAADAWIYPDAPGAMATLKRTSNIHAVKAEFLKISDEGEVEQIKQSEDMPNGYSQSVVDAIKAHSDEQFITVSGMPEGTKKAMKNSDETISKMVSLANEIDFGIELDWEGYGEWDDEYYNSYKQFVTQLADKLHQKGLKLAIDGPPITGESTQGWYKWRYEELAPLVDDIIMMVYDNQFDEGVGAPIAPREWTKQCLAWLKDKTGGKGIAGVAAYGYSGSEGSYRMAVNTSDEIKRRANGAEFKRNDDGELVARRGNTFYTYSDKETLQLRLKQVEESGLTRLSVWSLGGNPWFDNN